MNNSPFAILLTDADNIQRTLAGDTTNMTLVIEQRMLALQAHRKAQDDYDEAETEITFGVMFGGDENYANAKNAEQRKLVIDRAIIAARGKVPLAQPWRILNRCKIDLDNAQMAYDQAEARFKGVRVAADLQASMLMGLASDAKLMRG